MPILKAPGHTVLEVGKSLFCVPSHHPLGQHRLAFKASARVTGQCPLLLWVLWENEGHSTAPHIVSDPNQEWVWHFIGSSMQTKILVVSCIGPSHLISNLYGCCKNTKLWRGGWNLKHVNRASRKLRNHIWEPWEPHFIKRLPTLFRILQDLPANQSSVSVSPKGSCKEVRSDWGIILQMRNRVLLLLVYTSQFQQNQSVSVSGKIARLYRKGNTGKQWKENPDLTSLVLPWFLKFELLPLHSIFHCRYQTFGLVVWTGKAHTFPASSYVLIG